LEGGEEPPSFLFLAGAFLVEVRRDAIQRLFGHASFVLVSITVDSNQYAEALRAVREELDLSQDELAARALTTKNSIWRIETSRRFPMPETVEQHVEGFRRSGKLFTESHERKLRNAYGVDVQRRARRRLGEDDE